MGPRQRGSDDHATDGRSSVNPTSVAVNPWAPCDVEESAGEIADGGHMRLTLALVAVVALSGIAVAQDADPAKPETPKKAEPKKAEPKKEEPKKEEPKKEDPDKEALKDDDASIKKSLEDL